MVDVMVWICLMVSGAHLNDDSCRESSCFLEGKRRERDLSSGKTFTAIYPIVNRHACDVRKAVFAIVQLDRDGPVGEAMLTQLLRELDLRQASRFPSAHFSRTPAFPTFYLLAPFALVGSDFCGSGIGVEISH